ncbi:MAG: symmetrical bis(5'-nucleosyl)-tetraphosphatase [Comamonadaceae bacterium]|nr:MAG: symmetrical bis(5'-nucleosyl)-tetraphosphatase [Comamonadaceae bacterium]
MAMYLIGDVQGCDEPLARLLQTIDFSPSRDTLYMLGDLVNRGPDSSAVLRRMMFYGDAARCLLGNHDLHLLAVAHGVRRPHRGDTLDGILEAADRDAMIDWLRHQRMAFHENGCLMVHAGVLPQWTAQQAMALAAEVEDVLGGPQCGEFLHQMYGNEPDHFSDSLRGMNRIRAIVNALTRLRFCTPEGVMEFKVKEGADKAPAGFYPWFEVPGRVTAGTLIAFGHWSTLGWLKRDDVFSLDTGCVWGGCLSAMRLGTGGQANELIQVKCPQAQAPGK